MVIFVDLADEREPPQTQAHHGEWDGEIANFQLQQELVNNAAAHVPDNSTASGHEEKSGADHDVPENPNRSLMTAAFSCYPIVSSIVSWLDLNSLDNLSRSCRQIRASLLEHRGALVKWTLRCFQDESPLGPQENDMAHVRSISEDHRRQGTCARDMVGGCRRCGKPVCRNCIYRPQGSPTFNERHRRLCKVCTKAPLAALTNPPLLPNTPLDANEMQRAICTCQKDTLWLCATCGYSILDADQIYKRIWRWRNKYGKGLGGTGIGEGNRGVICGRDAACLGARAVEQQTDCGAADARNQPPFAASSNTGGITSGSWGRDANPQSTQHSASLSGASLRPGYTRHEIEGIGGVVKTKLVCMVPVGACVPEWDDEKHKEPVLEREVLGQRRSWCGWCWRVIPGAKDRVGKFMGAT
ncbi:hypothetical protein GGS21DRAFT_504667 [Xylaria nigripes]|nr:hypothetical protein GGS21DRAFT_504667 [Xylaria nigripes]